MVQPVSCCILLGSVVRVRVVLCRVLSCGKGVRPPFIDQGESESHVCRAI
jgi:hypothetical protein